MVIFDLDNFKALNDTYGHDVGDLVLVNVASQLKAALPGGMTLYRLGGEEFAIVAAPRARKSE
jgi:diguanylate cyclase (GGDEF)-like protein